MRRRNWRGGRLIGVALGVGMLLPGGARAQAGVVAGGYLDHQALTGAVQGLAAAHGTLARVSSLVRTDAGRDVWLLTLGSSGGRPLESRPALLLVANLEANRLAGSTAALVTAETLLNRYGQDDAVTRLLDTRTIYIIPRMNPDGAEQVFTMPGYELPWKPLGSDPSGGGLNVRERGADLNGDGLVTLMRVRDPEGTLMPHPDDLRVLRTANRTRAERGEFRIMVEGIDPEGLDAYVPMGTDGVNLNQNFPHEYRYFQPHVGPHMVSEVESRALADFLHDRSNLAAVLTFSAYDNLRTAPPAQRSVPEGVTGNPPAVPTNLLPDDRGFVDYVGERFREITGFSGGGAGGEAGSFPQMAYYHLGLPSFTTPVWSPVEREGGDAPGGDMGSPVDAAWLTWFDSSGVDGFVEWEAADHPTLGAVEVGGFRPNVRVNPPADELQELSGRHAEFAIWLAGQLPEVEIVDTRIEARGEGVFLITSTLVNEQYLPTQMSMGGRIRFNRPITVRLLPSDGMTVLSGNIQQQIPRIEGMGGRATFSWLVQATPGTNTTLEVFAERAGGLLSAPITLR